MSKKRRMGRPRKFRHPAAFTIMVERKFIQEARRAAKIKGVVLSDVVREALGQLIVRAMVEPLTQEKKGD